MFGTVLFCEGCCLKVSLFCYFYVFKISAVNLNSPWTFPDLNLFFAKLTSFFVIDSSHLHLYSPLLIILVAVDVIRFIYYLYLLSNRLCRRLCFILYVKQNLCAFCMVLWLFLLQKFVFKITFIYLLLGKFETRKKANNSVEGFKTEHSLDFQLIFCQIYGMGVFLLCLYYTIVFLLFFKNL